LGSAPDPARRAYSTPPEPLAGGEGASCPYAIRTPPLLPDLWASILGPYTSSIIVITRSILFSLKCTRNRLAAGLCPDPLVETLALPQTLRRIRRRDGTPGVVGNGG